MSKKKSKPPPSSGRGRELGEQCSPPAERHREAKAPGAKGRLSLTVQYACNDPALPLRPKLRRWVRAALIEQAACQITLRFVGEEEGRALNRNYRGKDYATNVLSFPYAPLPELAGDLVLCLPVVIKEAAAQAKPAEAHFAHLVVHGMLHLQGWDHETEADATLMEAREREVLARLGYPDPYDDAAMSHGADPFLLGTHPSPP